MIANKKPWGHECIAFQNENIAVWHLFIDPGQETSLHCHPNKKTGLVVLSGQARLHFLTDYKDLHPVDKIMIRHGVFHKTQNVGSEVLQLFEIETPVNKSDLVRIRDKYNRPSSYGIEEKIEIVQKYPWERSGRKKYQTEYVNSKNGAIVGLNRLYKEIDVKYVKEHIYCSNSVYMITSGGIYHEDICVCGPGDTVLGKTLNILANEFRILKSTEGIIIYK